MERDKVAPMDISTPWPNSMAQVIPSDMIRSMEDCLATFNRLDGFKKSRDAADTNTMINTRIRILEYFIINSFGFII